MKQLIAVLMLLLGACCMAQDESAMQPDGMVVVKGKTLKVGYLKQDKHLLLPVVEVAQAAGHTASCNAAEKTAQIDKTTIPVTVVDGHGYAPWKVLAPLLAPLELGLAPAKVFLYIPGPELQPAPPK